MHETALLVVSDVVIYKIMTREIQNYMLIERELHKTEWRCKSEKKKPVVLRYGIYMQSSYFVLFYNVLKIEDRNLYV